MQQPSKRFTIFCVNSVATDIFAGLYCPVQSLNRLYHVESKSYGIYLQIFARSGSVSAGRLLHAHILVRGEEKSRYLWSKLISFYCKCGRVLDARNVFDEMPKRNLLCWAVLIGAYARHGHWKETLELYDKMHEEGFAPNKYVIPSVLRACANLSDLERGSKIHEFVRSSSFASDVFVDSALVDMYAKCGCLGDARDVFAMMPRRDRVSWNTMVSSYAQYGMAEEARKLLGEMESEGIKPDSVTWNAVIVGFSQEGDVVKALKSFCDMQVDGIEPDIVSWTAMISGFVQNHFNDEALAIFRQMLLSGFVPTSVTLSALLPACANLENVKHGKEIHGYSIVIGVTDEVFVSSSLVDVYAKCGFVPEARKVFDMMPIRNTVSWNSMIYGYAMHGHAADALGLFNQMQIEGVNPDHITITIVLAACSHGGFVDEGWMYFKTMQHNHGLMPRMEHYAAMVDLFGRAGLLLEAYEFVKKMPIKPDFYVWGALLGACKIHGNVELGEVAASNLFKLEPDGSGSYILLSNILAHAGRWRDAAEVEKMMKRNRIKKMAGCSWIDAGQ